MTENWKNKWIAIAITAVISGLLTYLGIQGIGVYGMALFVLTPIFIGACPAVIYGRKNSITSGDARSLGFLALLVFAVGLIVFAMEGFICIVMAAPIGLLLTWIGSLIGYTIIKKAPNQGTTTMIILLLTIPSVAFVEKNDGESFDLVEVKTSVLIAASSEVVWKNVVEFPTLKEPTEFIFKTGIAYPINAEIQGQGVGAIRRCNFSTGSFVEPITIWDEPNLLKFDVAENPAPMEELSFYDLDAPHLHDYFVSKMGQFKVIRLENGQTQLEGTTWYYHRIKPAFYWRLWSEHIIHKIHVRVLTHIKEESEKERK